jgi:hypothetical protein
MDDVYMHKCLRINVRYYTVLFLSFTGSLLTLSQFMNNTTWYSDFNPIFKFLSTCSLEPLIF